MLAFKKLIVTVLLLSSNLAFAHIAGVTDTGINIKRSSVTLVYTVPSDNLKELDLDPTLSQEQAIENAIYAGFSVHNDKQECQLVETQKRSLASIGSQQFGFKIDCLSPIKTLHIGYDLFFNNDSSHKNFARISLANNTQNINFSAENKHHTVEVEKLLQQWIAMRNASKIPKAEIASSSHYFAVGVEHILIGFDHLLFLFALLLIPLKFKQLLMLVTSFTVAHSLTLALSVLDIVTLPAVIVEAAIAFSIVYVAVESIFVLRNSQPSIRDSAVWKRRLINCFLFGLLHGFGFSYILKEIGLGNQTTGALLYFNLGVEAGQLAVIAIACPLLHVLFKQFPSMRWAQGLSVVVGLIGLYWLIERSASLL